ncbi:MAG: hypothetical protein HKN47_28095 [Pirellulaceae bacterium]|nr:hypothetical protein [Pirellulaceae bacterium]
MSLFRDLRSDKAIYAKGILFVLLALFAGGLLMSRVWRWDVLMLLIICVWASCRAYYFAFYVIEKYVDGDYRFSGLIDFARYVLSSRKK